MLNIYRASAGSGKTHKLTGDYLRLLFSRENAFKHILAVTFTNKATDEMKQRILLELSNLADINKKSPFLEDIMQLERFKSEEYTELISSLGGLENFIRNKAEKILIEMLHDYSSFSVSTIDRFFQQTMRAFAREIGKFSSYKVELDQGMVLEAAVDRMYASLDNEESSELLDWLLKFSLESIEKGDSWNIRSSIFELGNEIFSEDFKIKSKAHKARLAEKGFMSSFKDVLKSIMNDFETNFKLNAKAFIDILTSEDYDGRALQPTDFAGGSRSPFTKIQAYAKGDVFELPSSLIAKIDNPDSWHVKPNKNNAELIDLIRGLYPELNPILNYIYEYYSKGYTQYLTAKVIDKNLYSLGILSDISRHLDEYTKEKNIVLLSETTEILNSIIDKNDAPFIYEKIGCWISNFMLDEFQDTSIMQWANFKPLLANSLASGEDNLIVGDIKQSIYRWRGSDSTVLSGKIAEDLPDYNIEFNSLDMNWRSAVNIINFNNGFFCFAGKLSSDKFKEDLEKLSGVDLDTNSDLAKSLSYADEIEEAYSDIAQNIPEQRTGVLGYIELNFIEILPEESKTWKDIVLGQLDSRLRLLLDSKYSPRDIAILVRSNNEGAMIADTLLRLGYSIISDDSLFISSSKLIQRLISHLKFINNPDDKINALLYQHNNPISSELPLYEICVEIIRVEIDRDAKLYSKQTPFIEAFMDIVLDYITNHGSNLSSFLDWWETYGRRKSISAPEGQDAIRIMTIHKSKGLGFKVCILPFANEKLDRSSNSLICCQPLVEPFSALGVIPIKCTKELPMTYFALDYQRERSYSYIDSLNLSYVAFTRAKDILIVFAPRPKEKKDGTYTVAAMSDILYSYALANLRNNLVVEEEILDFESQTKEYRMERYKIGEIIPLESEVDLYDTDLYGSDISIYDDSTYVSVPIADRLQLSLSSLDMFDEGNLRRRGLLMHSLLAKISSDSDVDRVVGSASKDGIIAESEMANIADLLKDMLAKVVDRNWFNLAQSDGQLFSSPIRELNEAGIITKFGDIKRPDRILIHPNNKVEIIDYKFGEHKRSSYRKQINQYKALFIEMGYVDVEGYLWYVELDEVEQV